MVFTFISRPYILHRASFLIILTILVFSPLPAFSKDDTTITQEDKAALEEMLRWLKAETYVLTASRIPEKIKKTAASITVITDRQIRQMGARNLLDVLQTMPGINLSCAPDGTFVIQNRMGYSGDGSSHVLLMVNSLPLNQNYTGSGLNPTYDTLIVDNIKRIEFLKSGASALYGANAFGGVINVITKEADDINGVEFTTRGGNFDTQQHNLLFGKTFNELEVAFNCNYFKTNGFDGHVEADWMTYWDQLTGTNVSLAPGSTNNDENKHDTSLTLKYQGFKFDGRYVHRRRDMMMVNVPFPVLTNKSTDTYEDYYLNLSYTGTLWDKLDVYGKVYRHHNHWRRHEQTNPPGAEILTVFPRGGAVIRPEGTYSIWEIKNNRTGIEIQTTYQLSDSNTFVAGGVYEEMKQFDHSRRATELSTYMFGVYIPLPGLWDLTDIQPTIPSVKRNVKAFFFEDIWDIKDNLRLNISGRYDRYSDFGDTFNPRVGLTWEYKTGYDIKLVYGSSFRAPSFAEFNQTVIGIRPRYIPEIDPEEADEFQISFGAEFTSSLNGRLTLWHAELEDAIQQSFGLYFNSFKWRAQGFEVELDYDFGRETYLALNYAYHRPISPHTIYRNIYTPRHTGNIMANIRLSDYLNFYAHCHIEDGFRRLPADTRDNVSGYATVDATLIAKEFFEGYEGLEIRASVYNLFDKDYTSPYSDPRMLPHDVPRPGRSFIIALKYKF